METEIFKPCPNAPGYFASNTGKIIGLKGYVLKSYPNQWGYPQVTVIVNGKRTCQRVHRLVAEALIPNPEGKPFVNHKDGVKNNSRVENLEWCTSKENSQHAKKVLKKQVGENSSNCTHDDIQILTLLTYLPNRSLTIKEVAQRLGVSVHLAYKIHRGSSWKDLLEEVGRGPNQGVA